MKVKQLIKVLKTMPQDEEVWHLWDGDLRTTIEHVWVGKSGRVVTSDLDQVCYSVEDLPEGEAIRGKDGYYWRTSEKPMFSE